ncbi:MAG: hypothetical protein JST86_13910 [Bacteroidetes bacterium]|nr:hypothetical protein [Bacteroidota bacterium]
MKWHFTVWRFPFIVAAGFVLMVNSCTSNTADTNAPNASTVDDTTHYAGQDQTGNEAGNKALNGPVGNEDAAAKEERRKMILMQIDSTYNAIALLDDAKNEMTSLSPDALSGAERNKKSKAIFSINLIQNELTRALDASILANLKIKTDELAGITAEMEKNVEHLQKVTEKLNKATVCIGRLTNLLAMGLSKGIIKPITPRGKQAEVTAAATTAN